MLSMFRTVTDEEWAMVLLLLENGFKPTAEGHFELRLTKQEAIWWDIAEGISKGTFRDLDMLPCKCGYTGRATGV